MTSSYEVVQSTMATKAGDKKWHLNLVKIGKTVSIQQLTEMIAEKSPLTPGDVHNVVRNLTTAMRGELLNSKTVCLEGLGTFAMKACSRGRGVDKEEDVNPNQVGALFCHLIPEYIRPAAIGTTRVLLQGVEFQEIGSVGISGGSGSGNGDGDIVGNPTT